MIIFLDSVCVGRQFAKKIRSESLVRSVEFPVAVNRSWNARFSAESVRLSSSLVLILKWLWKLVINQHNITTLIKRSGMGV